MDECPLTEVSRSIALGYGLGYGQEPNAKCVCHDLPVYSPDSVSAEDGGQLVPLAPVPMHGDVGATKGAHVGLQKTIENN